MTNPLRKEPSEFGLNLLRMLLVAILNYATAYGTKKFQGKVKKSFLTLLLSPVVHSKKKKKKEQIFQNPNTTDVKNSLYLHC